MIHKQKSILLKFAKILSIVVFVVYLSYLSYLTFFSHIYGRTYMHRSVNMIPFKTIIFYMNASINNDIILTNIVGNIVAFVPLGFLLPFINKRLHGWKETMLGVLLATITVEVIQYAAAVGATDIDDIILNTVGGFIGYVFSRIAVRLLMFLQIIKIGE